ncbi:MAG: DUF2341 domain-containing protein [Candidatus Bathyarchaeota archaeon]|nr:MAG: DUF2341 domain-containing protein [Candidatus Bathyarchaeota archaeon]
MGNIPRGKKAVSNVIVTVLSLVILAIVFANVILWNYDMNQLDWEKIREEIEITDVSRVTGSPWFMTQSEYVVNTGGRTSGDYTGTQAIDAEYERFTEAGAYTGGLSWWNSSYGNRQQMNITNSLTSRLDAGYSTLLTMDTASLVSSGKILSDGKDLRIVYWNGTSSVEIDRDIIEMNTTTTQVWFKTHAGIDPTETDSNYYLYYSNPLAQNPPGNRSNVYLWFDDFSTNTTDNYDVDRHAASWFGFGSNVYEPYWDPSHEAVYFDTGDNYVGDWMPVTISETDVYAEMKMNITGSYSINSTNGILFRWQNSFNFYAGHISGDSYSSPCIARNTRTGYISCKIPSEYHTWNQPFTISVAVYSDDLRLWVNGVSKVNGTSTQITEAGRVSFLVSQSTGWMDDFKIRKYVEPEPTVTLGTEESQNDNRLDITGPFIIDIYAAPLTYIQTIEIQMRYRVSDVNEKWFLKTLNWTALEYSDAGFNFTEGHSSSIGWNTYTVNLADDWNSYIHSNGTVKVKIVDEGEDGNQTTLDVDFLAVRAALDGSAFTLKNKGSATSHFVSLWVNNATHHRRFDVNIFINAGDTESYIRIDISHDENCTVKFVTERGNIAVYSLSN